MKPKPLTEDEWTTIRTTAVRIGFKQRTTDKWRENGCVPALKAGKVAKATGITLERLNPEAFA